MFWGIGEKKAETSSKSEKKFRAVLDSSNDLIFILDDDLSVVEVNEKVAQSLGFSTTELVGKKFFQLKIFVENQERNQKFLAEIKNKKKIESAEIVLIDRYGNKVEAEAKFDFLPDGAAEFILVLEEKRSGVHDLLGSANLDFLTEAALKLVEPLPMKDIYQYIADQLSKIVKESFIFVMEMTAAQKSKVISYASSSKGLTKGLFMITKNPIGMTFDINPKADFFFNRNKLLKITGGLYELSFGKVPKALCRIVEKTVGVGNIYVMGFFWKGELFGSATIITREKSEKLAAEGMVETFVNQASVALQRRKAEEQLKQTVDELNIEKINLKDEKDKIKTIIESVGEGVLVVGKDKKLILFNKTAELLSGYLAKEVISKNYLEKLKFFDQKDDQESNDFAAKCLKDGRVIKETGKITLRSAEGEKLPVDLIVAPLQSREGKISGCVVVFWDATKERQIDQAKSEFVSLASHQLRTPLSAINWYSELLMDKKSGELNKTQKEYLDNVYASSRRMVQLVSALLNVSRLELGTFIVEPELLDFVVIAEDVIKEMKPKILEKKLKISENYQDGIGKLSGDPNLTRIIFQNLISNAVKYTPNGGKIEVAISKENPATAERGSILIKVADNGYGIPRKEQPKIFSKLFRGDNIKAKESEGTGLGLYIVKSIIDQCGGKIRFESKENQGTTFFVTFPLSGMAKKSGSKTLELEKEEI